MECKGYGKEVKTKATPLPRNISIGAVISFYSAFRSNKLFYQLSRPPRPHHLRRVTLESFFPEENYLLYFITSVFKNAESESQKATKGCDCILLNITKFNRN